MNLPDSVAKSIEKSGHDVFWEALVAARKEGHPESVCYAKAWNALLFKGYRENESGIWEKVSRFLVKHDDKTSKIPFPHDQEAIGRLRPDQTPRFLGALTHPQNLEIKDLSFDDLIAIQNRVSTEKIDALMGEADDGEPAGTVARFDGGDHILDGHHRIVARWMQGADKVKVRFINLNPLSNAMKAKDGPESEPFTFSHDVRKIDEEMRMVYGWASVVEENGNPVVDHQGDLILSSDLVAAAHAFISSSRAAKAMHKGEVVGEFVESLVFTPEVQKALGIDLGKVGWWVGLKVKNDKIWAAVKDGRLKMLSIGGKGNRIDNA